MEILDLTTVFESSLTFEVSKCTKGETNNFVTTLKSAGSVEIAGMKVKKSITLYVSLIEAVKVGKEINIDPEQWSVFYSPYVLEETGEEIELKWITPKA